MRSFLSVAVVLALGHAGCKSNTKTNEHSKLKLTTTFSDNYVVVHQPESKTYISFLVKPSDPKKLDSKMLNQISEKFNFDGIDGIKFESFQEQYVSSVNEGGQCPDARGGPLQLPQGMLLSVLQQEGKDVYVLLTHPGLGPKPFLQFAIKPEAAPCVKEFNMAKLEKFATSLIVVYAKFAMDMKDKGIEMPDTPENGVAAGNGEDKAAKTQTAEVKAHNAGDETQV